jgi:hypothetical protein
MKRLWIVAALMVAVMALPLVARAHEGHMHKALGTITGVQAERVEIKTTDGKALTVVIDKKTAITRGTEKLDATALKVGERLSVDYMEQKKTMIAHTIKLGTTTAAAKK